MDKMQFGIPKCDEDICEKHKAMQSKRSKIKDTRKILMKGFLF